jgi:hypothetical protein
MVRIRGLDKLAELLWAGINPAATLRCGDRLMWPCWRG